MINSIDSNNNLNFPKPASTQPPDALRQAAVQFESLLLLQLTSALNGSSEAGEEDNLFGNDGGTNLAKQMFSEQLANSMAQSGGVGLADLITSKLGGNQTNNISSSTSKTNLALSAIKDIRGKSEPSALAGGSSNRLDNTFARKRDFSIEPKTRPLTQTVLTDDIEIVSTAAEDIAKYGDADLPKPVMGDEKLFKYYRPRIVPDYALNLDSVKNVETATPIVNKASLAATTVVNYQMPVRGKISSDFGDRFHPIDRKHKFHAGIDIAAAQGTPIATAASGTVAFAGWRNGYGNLVIIEHPDGRQTRYGHASKLFVATGETVAAGQKIAAVGSTGKSTGPHLHFEMRENDRPVNPLKFMP